MKIIFAFLLFLFSVAPALATSNETWWMIQAIDTMKVSRDRAREALAKPDAFDTIIDTEAQVAADAGATHLSIGTPYDEEFIPVLTRWVEAARKHGLHVWFRGNFAGWEKWFGYPPITRAQHTEKLRAFLTAHRDLFENDDLFSPCPECENGGPGDPRRTGDVTGFRDFMIEERNLARSIFQQQRVRVGTNLASMNGDVALLIMDPPTTKKMGGVVTIDHYTKTDTELADFVRKIADSSQGVVVLGEYGAPIPDIHGPMTATQQNTWIDETLHTLVPMKVVKGINYWTLTDGSTALRDNGINKPAYDTLAGYFRPQIMTGTVVSVNKNPVQSAQVSTAARHVFTDSMGHFSIPVLPDDRSATVTQADFDEQTISLTDNQEIVLYPHLPKICTLIPLLRTICLKFSQ